MLQDVNITEIKWPDTLPESMPQWAELLEGERLLFHDDKLNQSLDFSYNHNMDIGFQTAFINWIAYEWSFEVLHYFVALRDTIFVWHKSKMYLSDHRLSESNYQVKCDEIYREISKIRLKLLADYETKFKDFSNENDKQWSLYMQGFANTLNPIPEIKKQLLVAIHQGQRIIEENGLLLDQINCFNRIKHLIGVENDRVLAEIIHFKKISDRFKKYVDDVESRRDLNEMEQQLKSEYQVLEQFDRQLDLGTEIESIVANYPRIKNVIIARQDSKLILSQEGFTEQAISWMESNLSPIYLQLNAKLIELRSTFKISVVNILNFLSLKSTESAEPVEGKQFQTIFYQVNPKIGQDEISIKESLNQVGSLLKDHLYVSKIFDTKDNFILNSYQDGSRELERMTGGIQGKLSHWVSQVSTAWNGFLNTLSYEENLSDNELLIRYLKTHKIKEQNINYNNIFLTRGYIGTSFAVGRSLEIENIKTSFKLWMEGYRGSVALIGRRNCGKSFLGEYFLNNYCDAPFIKIEKNTTLRYEGRDHSVTDDLSKTLSFLTKFGDKKYVVWIDDIEYFWNNEFHLNRNFKELSKFIELHGSRFFVIMTTNIVLYHWLNSQQAFNEIFQNTIDCTVMEEDDIAGAMQIRHQATHCLIESDSNEILTREQLDRLFKRLAVQKENIIGEVLYDWLLRLKPVKNEVLKYAPLPRHRFPQLKNQDEWLLLREIYIQRRTTELQLRKRFGRDFNDNFRGVLKRLRNKGLVSRVNESQLKISDSCIYEVENQLINQIKGKSSKSYDK